MDDMALIHGKLKPGAGNISGEQSFQAHFRPGETDTGTLKFHTLTTLPRKAEVIETCLVIRSVNGHGIVSSGSISV
jgi:hypothetical protein